MKTPKQEAEDLIHDFDLMQTYVEGFSLEDAKHCATIAVKKIISASPSLPILSDAGSFVNDIEESTEYWQEVLKEIENYEP